MMGAATAPQTHRLERDNPILARGGGENELLELAARYQAAGLSIIVVGDDKKPYGRWGDAMTRQLTPDELRPQLRRGGTGLAVVSGAVSGGLVVFDFDQDKSGRAREPFDLENMFVQPWREDISGYVDPDTLPCQRTPSGGVQFYVRCPEMVRRPEMAVGNTKLAGVPAWKIADGHVLVGTPSTPHYAIETRGQGGYAVIPTPGSGRELIHLDLLSIPTITPDQLEVLLEAARRLDRVPKLATPKRTAQVPHWNGGAQNFGESPITAFNAAHTVAELLERYGYVLDNSTKNYLCPESTSRNAGVQILKDEQRCFSYHASDPLADGKVHDAFDIYRILEHGGDQAAALAALRAERDSGTATAAHARLETTADERAKLLGAPTPASTDPEPTDDAALRAGLELAERYGCTTEVCGGRYLSPAPFRAGVTLERAGMGTGKSDAVAHWVRSSDPDQSVIAVSSLVGLTAKSATDLAIDDYRDIPHGYEKSSRRTAYCVNSLWRLLIGGGQVPQRDVVFIDEIELLLKRLTSREKFTHKRACLRVLKTLVRNARYVILADAHLGPTTLRWIRRLRPQDTPHMVLSTHRPGVGRSLYRHERRGDVRAVARDRLRAGQRVYYALNGLEQAKGLEGWVSELRGELPGLKTLLVCSETMADPDVRAFFADPTGEAAKYDLIMASPSVSTGVSIRAGVVDVVCSELSSHVGTPHDGMQMLMRAREVGELHVWVDDRRNTKPTNRADILAAFWDDPGDDGNMVADDDDGLGGVEQDYAELYLDVVVESNSSVNRYAELFFELIDDDGFTVLDGDSSPDARTIERHGREAAKARDVRGHLEARDLTDEEDAALAARPEGDLAQAELYARKRHRLKQFYRLPEQPTDEELLAVYVADSGGTLRRQLQHLELAAATPETVSELMERQRGTLAPNVIRYDHQHAAYKHTLEVAGLEGETWQTSGEQYDAETLRERWVRPLEADWNVYCVSVPSWPELEAARRDPVRAFGNTLRAAFGLGQRNARNEAGRRYHLSTAQLERARYWLERRARLAHGESEPYPRPEWAELTGRQINAYITNSANVPPVSPADETDKCLYTNPASVSRVSNSSLALAERPPEPPRPEPPNWPLAPVSELVNCREFPDYERLRAFVRVQSRSENRTRLLESFRHADSGDAGAREAIVAYLQNPAIQVLLGAAA